MKHIIQTTKGNAPWQCNDFFRSPTFVEDFIKICHCCNAILKNEKRVLELKSPLYVLGDIHGNLEDLRFFGNTLWPLGLNLMGVSSVSISLTLFDHFSNKFLFIRCVAAGWCIIYG